MPMCNLVKNFECQCPLFHARPVQRLLQRKNFGFANNIPVEIGHANKFPV